MQPKGFFARLDHYMLLQHPVIWEMRPSLILKLGLVYAGIALMLGLSVINEATANMFSNSIGESEGMWIALLGIPVGLYWLREHLQYNTESIYGNMGPKQARLRFSCYLLLSAGFLAMPFLPIFIGTATRHAVASRKYAEQVEKLKKGGLYFLNLTDDKGDNFNILDYRDHFSTYPVPEMWGEKVQFASAEVVKAKVEDMTDKPDIEAIEGVLEVAREYNISEAALITPDNIVGVLRHERRAEYNTWDWQTPQIKMKKYASWDKDFWLKAVMAGSIMSMGLSLFLQAAKHAPKGHLWTMIWTFPITCALYNIFLVSTALWAFQINKSAYGILILFIFTLMGSILYSKNNNSGITYLEVAFQTFFWATISGMISLSLLAMAAEAQLMKDIFGVASFPIWAFILLFNTGMYAFFFTPHINRLYLALGARPKLK